MEFDIEKCTMLRITKETIEGIKLSNKETNRTFGEKENYKYLGVLEEVTIKQAEMKEKIREEYLRKTRKLLNLCRINLIKGINTRAAPL